MVSEAYLDRDTVLHPRDAVAAILLLPDGRYVLQRRDDKRGIFFPGHWSLFGGALEPGESDEAALRRELVEELAFDARDRPLAYFTRFDFDLGFAGLAPIYRTFFEVTISEEEFAACRLSEGHSFAAMDWCEVLKLDRLTPYDTFALWMHINRAGLRP